MPAYGYGLGKAFGIKFNKFVNAVTTWLFGDNGGSQKFGDDGGSEKFGDS